MKTTILAERENEQLIKLEDTMQIEETEYKTVRYEWWTNLEKMKQGIQGEEVNGHMYIYCRGFAGANEKGLIEMFENNNFNQPT